MHRTALVDGVRLHYAEAGSGPPLLLVHGFPQDWTMWKQLIPLLATRYRVIAVDMRGAGTSDAPADGYGKDEIADELARFLEVVGARRARVVGHDWGGFVGFQLALRHPDQVERFVALNIATPTPDSTALADAWRFAYQPVLAMPVLGALLLRTPGVVRAMLRGAAHRHVWSEQDLDRYERSFRDPARAAAGSAMYRTFLARELLPWARGELSRTQLQPPTLVLLGAEDPIIRPTLARAGNEHARDLSVEVVPDAGHFLAEERPDIVARRLFEFLG